jgi:cation diffusion facilitator CzcD-associated flavoprotein CzcO
MKKEGVIDHRSMHVHIAIVGSGFSGLGAAIRIKQAGIDDFVVFERAQEVGGTWRDNSYPGCACDVPSHLYSFSFAPNPSWSRSFSPQAEILAYLRRCAADHGILPHLCFGHELLEAAWDEPAQRWRLRTSAGSYTADVMIAATGAFSQPSMPPIAGLDRFEGKVFHSARWDHEHDLAGGRVAVIGTGASAVQFVPAIQPRVSKLMLFQRTPAWVLPRRDRAVSAREGRAFRALPATQSLMRLAIYLRNELVVFGFRRPALLHVIQKQALRFLERSVADPVLREKLTPDYRIGCKRIVLSDDYLPSLGQSNVELVTQPIREIRSASLVTADGAEHVADTIICGTGFRVTDLPLAHFIRGREGRTLADSWQGSPKAHFGTMVAGYPNLFLLLGPNTGLGHTSVIIMVESQLKIVLGALDHMRKRGVRTVEPRPEAQARFVAEIEKRMQGSVWTSGGCASWYIDATGRNSTLWPGFTFSFMQRARFRPAEYENS